MQPTPLEAQLNDLLVQHDAVARAWDLLSEAQGPNDLRYAQQLFRERVMATDVTAEVADKLTALAIRQTRPRQSFR